MRLTLRHTAAAGLCAALGLAAGAARAGKPPDPAERKGDVVILYEHDNFVGRSASFSSDTDDLSALNFNDAASSLKVKIGYQATFYEDSLGRGEWFTYNCPPPIGLKTGEYCELKSIGGDIATGTLCQFRPEGSHGCVHWWNDRISSVKGIKPCDMSKPQGRIDEGHN